MIPYLTACSGIPLYPVRTTGTTSPQGTSVPALACGSSRGNDSLLDTGQCAKVASDLLYRPFPNHPASLKSTSRPERSRSVHKSSLFDRPKGGSFEDFSGDEAWVADFSVALIFYGSFLHQGKNDHPRRKRTPALDATLALAQSRCSTGFSGLARSSKTVW